MVESTVPAHSDQITTRVPAGAGVVRSVTSSPSMRTRSAVMWLDAGLGQPGRDQSVEHGRRGGLVVAHTVIVQPGTDSSLRFGAARVNGQSR